MKARTPKAAGNSRDLCPVLRSIRIRLRGRLAKVDEAIVERAQPGMNGADILEALQRERAAVVASLELVAGASERGIERDTRRRWLETLLATAPACVTPKARQRLRHLIEGLSDTA